MIKGLLLLCLVVYLVRQKNRRKTTRPQPQPQPTKPAIPRVFANVAQFQATQTPEASQLKPSEPGFEEASAAKLKQYISFIRERQLVAPTNTLPIPYDDGVNRSQETQIELNSELTQITHSLTELDIDVATAMAYQEYLKLKATTKGQALLAEILQQ